VRTFIIDLWGSRARIGTRSKEGPGNKKRSLAMKQRKRCIPLTYAPKIPGVIAGDIRQTIRIDADYQIGDLISFHGWEGKPYRSHWSFRTPYFPVRLAEPIKILPQGIMWPIDMGIVWEWDSQLINDLALQDGVYKYLNQSPGVCLKTVLQSFHGQIPEKGFEAIIIRW
jgi:hypothetical protein